MGEWFADFLSENGYKILISDKNVPAARSLARKKGFTLVKNSMHAAQLSEIILLATPTLVTMSLMKRIASDAGRDKLIVEISSVKEPIRKTIQSVTCEGAQILSIHPMFGPGAGSLAGKSIIVAKEPRDCPLAKRLLSTLTRNGARITRTNLEDHDQLVAATLALPHLMNFAFIETIRKVGLPLNKARELGGTTFKLQLLIAEALYHESPDNEASILMGNKHNMRAFGTFVQQINQVRDIIQRKPQSELQRRLREDITFARKDRLFSSAHERFVAAVEASTRP